MSCVPFSVADACISDKSKLQTAPFSVEREPFRALPRKLVNQCVASPIPAIADNVRARLAP